MNIFEFQKYIKEKKLQDIFTQRINEVYLNLEIQNHTFLGNEPEIAKYFLDKGFYVNKSISESYCENDIFYFVTTNIGFNIKDLFFFLHMKFKTYDIYDKHLLKIIFNFLV